MLNTIRAASWSVLDLAPSNTQGTHNRLYLHSVLSGSYSPQKKGCPNLVFWCKKKYTVLNVILIGRRY